MPSDEICVGLAPIGKKCVVFTNNGIKIFDPISVSVRDVPSKVGCLSRDSIIEIDRGGMKMPSKREVQQAQLLVGPLDKTWGERAMVLIAGAIDAAAVDARRNALREARELNQSCLLPAALEKGAAEERAAVLAIVQEMIDRGQGLCCDECEGLIEARQAIEARGKP